MVDHEVRSLFCMEICSHVGVILHIALSTILQNLQVSNTQTFIS